MCRSSRASSAPAFRPTTEPRTGAQSMTARLPRCEPRVMAAIRANLFHCRIGARYIFFDLEADRYFMLAADPALRFERFIAATADDADVRWLAERGIVDAEAAAGFQKPPHIEPPDAEYARDRGARTSIWLVLESAAAQRAAQARLRRGRLADTFAWLARLQSKATGGPGQVPISVATAFDRSRRLLTAADRCLPRSIAMACVLARHSCRAQLVIGVTIPFAAHCWVQHGSIVLSDPLDRIRRFTPIFALS